MTLFLGDHSITPTVQSQVSANYLAGIRSISVVLLVSQCWNRHPEPWYQQQLSALRCSLGTDVELTACTSDTPSRIVTRIAPVLALIRSRSYTRLLLSSEICSGLSSATTIIDFSANVVFPILLTRLQDLPLLEAGSDSIFDVADAFVHVWPSAIFDRIEPGQGCQHVT